ncbi:hypothetical protein BAE44_0010014 [Dichanthelium oligosanthes]|uniref:DUF4220 domain-containing protein n=1 Tax=Dichanthelium oligosanthes TaxID=888268 RepID=A0A1E5VV14_9POAL|nr:hypothetical protein BAE44_0010014 [Dichanthelium oligosanthes]
MKAIFSLFDAVSDSILTYLLGAMQTAPFKNQLFPVWALVLVIFRHSVDFISGYGVPDRGGRRFTEWRNVVRLLGSAFLNWTRGSRFAYPLWSLWFLQVGRSWYRLRSHNLASISVWHGRSSELVSAHMCADHNSNNWKPEECDPRTMDGYKYLVYGERVKLQKPQYVLRINDTAAAYHLRREPPRGRHLSAQEDTANSKKITRSSLITLDKIWKCRRHLLLSGSDANKSEDKSQGKDLKDLSLAFALSRLLRCRLEDVTLQENIYKINRKLVRTTIIDKKDAQAFGIMELQLAFINDYFNTRYPMVFWSGVPSLIISLVLSVVTFGVVCWLSVAIRNVYEPPHDELAHVVNGFNVDMIITWVFMSFMMFKEIWEMVIYLVSDWTRLLLVCSYAQWDDERIRNVCTERVILSFFKSKVIGKRWHGLLDQYVFVQSYDDRPKIWNLFHNITTGMVPKKEDGAKLSSAINIPDCVRSAILEKLRAILEVPIVVDLTEPANANRNLDEQVNRERLYLPKVITTLSGERMKRYSWAYKLQTSSQVILVWHIATSFCEMALAKKHSIDLSNPDCLDSIWSCFTGFFSSKPYLVAVDEHKKTKKKLLCSFLSCFTDCCSSKSNEKNKNKYKLTEEVEERYIIANSLSRYCGYLLVSKPDLIPDSFLVPKLVFQRTVKSAHKILKNCDSLERRYKKLSLEECKSAEDFDNLKEGEDVVRQGAMLGKELLAHTGEEGCWEILAGVWAELLIHIAPTWNAEAHKKCLESGGEFITNIWSLLWHCGIEKSRLWPAEDASEDNDPADHQDNNFGDNHADTVENTQLAGTEIRNSQTRIEDHEEDEIVEAKEPEASNLRTRQREIRA